MFVVRDKQHPGVSGLTSYHRTRDEAEAYVAGCTRHDRDGEHPGSEYLEVGEIDRESKPCTFCGGEVESNNAETDFCRSCFYGGRSHERAKADLIGRLRGLDGVASAEVWHTGGGCFILAVTLADGRLLTPSVGYTNDGDGTVWPEPAFPEGDERWCLVVSESQQAFDEWDESKVTMSDDLYTDDELVGAITALTSGAPSGPFRYGTLGGV